MARLIEITGKALSGEWGSDDDTGNGIPVLRTTNFTNDGIVDYTSVVTRTITKKNISDKFLRTGDIIIEKSGGSDKQPVGRVIYFDGAEYTYLFNNFTGLLRVQDTAKWYPRYVFYALFANYRNGGTKQYENKTTGLHNLKTDDYVSRFEIHEVSLNTQCVVCNILDKIRSIITFRKQQLTELDTLVKARFVEMFGDIEAGTCNYPTQRLRDLSTKISDGVHAKPEYTETGRPFLSVVNINKGVVDFSDCKYVSEEAYQKMVKSTNPQRGDVLYTKVGATYGIPAYIDTDHEFCLYVSVCLIKPKHELINARFLALQMAMPSIKHQADARIKGIGVPDLHLNQISEFMIVCPPRTLQDDFVAFVEQVDKSKSLVQKALEEAQTLFDSLMQQYFG